MGMFSKMAIAISALIASASNVHAQQVDPNANIKWNLNSGSGSPTSLGLMCSASNYGQPYQDTSSNPSGHYRCGTAGWEQDAVLSRSGALSASVNSQINVMMYGARGDCVTDDHNAIIAAQTAALAVPNGAGLLFPKPPGGCYLTSTVDWQGVGLSGQDANSMTIVRGMPGQDVLHVKDPTTYSFQWMKDCAGPGGANLVTRIQSVQPCMGAGAGWRTITLAAAASSSVRNAHTYVSVLNLPVTQTIGNCAIAFDNLDGLTSHWKFSPWQNVGNTYDVIRDVEFRSFKGATDSQTCAIYTTGAWNLYGIDVRNYMIRDLRWGVVQSASELNSFRQGAAGDFEKWDHGSMEGVTYPWVSYNGGENKIEDLELTTTSGPQILSLGNYWADYNSNWYINVPEHEYESGVGWNVSGSFMTFVNNSFGAAKAQIYTANSVCTNCQFLGNLDIGGYNNEMDVGGDMSAATVRNYGFGNRVTYRYTSNPFHGLPTAYRIPAVPMKRFDTKGLFGADAISDGNPGTSYNLDDLVLWPKDVVFNISNMGLTGTTNPWGHVYQDDSTSPTGGYTIYVPGKVIANWNQFATEAMIVGTNIPASTVMLSLLAKCPSGQDSATFKWGVLGARYRHVVIGTRKLTCTTSYQTYSFPADFTNFVGGQVFFGTTDNPLYAAWTAVTPFKNLWGTINGAKPSVELPGETRRIGGSALAAGGCASDTVRVSGATTSMAVVASPAGTSPGDGYIWQAYVSNADAVTVKVCAIAGGTPTATTYNVRVIQ
jgi:hypothetical protein